MKLAELFEKYKTKGVATATVATPATLSGNKAPTVAKVARIAVAKPIERKNTPLSAGEERAIRKWLSSINEADQETISDLLERCQTDMQGKHYLLGEAAKVSAQEELEAPGPDCRVTCGECRHFKRRDHPIFGKHQHLGHCSAGEPEAVCGLWDTSQRWCKSFQALE